MGKQVQSKRGTVIPLTFNADFFTDRAAKSLDRYNFPKALRYFKRACEIEPDNPLHLCNMAGVLAELGRFEESNEMLERVLDEHGAVAECHYYLACNYANMNLLEEAEEHALTYLELDRLGRYAEDAEELLDYVSSELNRPPAALPPGGDEPEDEETMLHDKARRLLEEGSFQQACHLLEELVMDNPDFLAAGNNLSLCYFYMGRFEQAMDAAQQVLEKDPHNIHGLCNLAVFYSHRKETGRLNRLLAKLKKIVPFQYDLSSKLATTLGIMGEHETAYLLFKKMLKFTWQPDIMLLHYCAASAYNTERFKEAEKYWKMVRMEDPQSAVAAYYLERLNGNREDLPRPIPYYYNLPPGQYKLQKGRSPKQFLLEEVKTDPLVRSSFLWALRYGDEDMKQQVLQALEWLADDEAVEALEKFIQGPVEDHLLKEMAFFVLNMISRVPDSIRQYGDDHLKKNWHAVIDAAEVHMSEEMLEKARRLWSRFIHERYPDVPVIRKPEAWAAALEWLLTRDEQIPPTAKSIAGRYGVLPATVIKNAAQLDESSDRTL